MTRALHFVYNVEATPQALVKDFIHRLVSPETYPCRLCDVTYGRFVKKPGWQLFLWSLPVKTAFYTKGSFVKKFPAWSHQEFPAVFAEDEAGQLSVFISAREFSSIASLAALESEVTARLKARDAVNA
jgi:hypothetical protein